MPCCMLTVLPRLDVLTPRLTDANRQQCHHGYDHDLLSSRNDSPAIRGLIGINDAALMHFNGQSAPIYREGNSITVSSTVSSTNEGTLVVSLVGVADHTRLH